MNVGELLKEIDRLEAVIEEAKEAKHRIKQLKILVTMYGDDEKVALVNLKQFKCDVNSCDRAFETPQALGTHKAKTHDVAGASRARKAMAHARAAKKGIRRVS